VHLIRKWKHDIYTYFLDSLPDDANRHSLFILQTPNAHSLASSGYRDNGFYLLVPNPVEGGGYSCHVPEAESCLHGHNSSTASFTLDKLEARLVVLEAKDIELETKVTELQAKNAALEVQIVDLENKVGTSKNNETFFYTNQEINY
jgi:hypothetical protein